MDEKHYNLHQSLGYQATLTSRVFERRLEDGLRDLGLTRLGWCILLAIGEEGHHSPSSIADFIGTDRTATSRALRQLEAGQLIARRTHPRDRRRTHVSLTASGEDRLKRAITIAAENNDHFRRKLSDEDNSVLIELLERLRTGEPTRLANF
ncbi:MAG: MarR family transcriptional regulator [Litoreibacter sp.]|nr:MarR family transcriptional regulator [Litoreibacter sp.]